MSSEWEPVWIWFQTLLHIRSKTGFESGSNYLLASKFDFKADLLTIKYTKNKKNKKNQSIKPVCNPIC